MTVGIDNMRADADAVARRLTRYGNKIKRWASVLFQTGEVRIDAFFDEDEVTTDDTFVGDVIGFMKTYYCKLQKTNLMGPVGSPFRMYVFQFLVTHMLVMEVSLFIEHTQQLVHAWTHVKTDNIQMYVTSAEAKYLGLSTYWSKSR